MKRMRLMKSPRLMKSVRKMKSPRLMNSLRTTMSGRTRLTLLGLQANTILIALIMSHLTTLRTPIDVKFGADALIQGRMRPTLLANFTAPTR